MNLCNYYKQRTYRSCYRGINCQNDIFNKKSAQGHDSFDKLNEEEVPLPNASPSIEISNTQYPITSDNEILEPSKEGPRDFDKTSNTIIDIQTPTLQSSLPFKNLRYARYQKY